MSAACVLHQSQHRYNELVSPRKRLIKSREQPRRNNFRKRPSFFPRDVRVGRPAHHSVLWPRAVSPTQAAIAAAAARVHVPLSAL